MIRFQMGEEVIVKFQGGNAIRHQGKICHIIMSLGDRFPSYEVKVKYGYRQGEVFILTAADNLQFSCKYEIPPWMVYKLEEA